MEFTTGVDMLPREYGYVVIVVAISGFFNFGWLLKFVKPAKRGCKPSGRQCWVAPHFPRKLLLKYIGREASGDHGYAAIKWFNSLRNDHDIFKIQLMLLQQVAAYLLKQYWKNF